MGIHVWIVNADCTSDGIISIISIQRNLTIRITVVVELFDDAVDGNIWFLLFLQLSADSNICSDSTELCVVKQLAQVDSIRINVSTKLLIGIHVYLDIDIANS